MARAGQPLHAGSFAFLTCLLMSAVVIAEVDSTPSVTPTQTEQTPEGSPNEAQEPAPENAGRDALTWTEDGAADFGTSEDDVEQISLMTMLSKLGLGLGAVVLLGWGILTALKKTSIVQQFGSVGGVIQVVERNYLAPKKAIYLVQIGEKVLALGVTDAQIGLLSEWAEGELDLKGKTAASFAGQMKSMVAGLGNKQAPLAEAQS